MSGNKTRSYLRATSAKNIADITGIDQVINELRRLPKELHDGVMIKAAKQSARIVQYRAKSNLLRHARGTDSGFSKVRFIARNIQISNLKRRSTSDRPGVRVHVKGPDISVKGSRWGYWNIAGYAKLLSAGSYIDYQRRGRGRGIRRSSSTQSHGHFEGFGNYVVDAYEQNKGVVVNIYRRNIIKEVEKAERRVFRKAMRRYAA